MGRSAVRAALAAALLTIALPAAPAAQDAIPLACGPGIHAGEAIGFIPLPQGDLFCPLVADPKEPRTFASVVRGTTPALDTDVGAMGIGDSFGLLRLGGPRPGDGLQLSLVASVFTQFDLRTESYDLLNADYIVGLPLTFRIGGFSGRVRVYHQSSHLGDEFLLRIQPERINLSFESLEVLLSQELGPLRVYGGGEYLFNREPEDLEQRLAHVGAEYRMGRIGGVGLVGAVDVKSTEEQNWTPAWSARGGIEVNWGRDPGHPARMWSILAEFYQGPSPYGQFYRDNIRYVGHGVHLTL